MDCVTKDSARFPAFATVKPVPEKFFFTQGELIVIAKVVLAYLQRFDGESAVYVARSVDMMGDQREQGLAQFSLPQLEAMALRGVVRANAFELSEDLRSVRGSDPDLEALTRNLKRLQSIAAKLGDPLLS